MDSDLPAVARHAAHVLAAHLDRAAQCFLSNATLAKKMGLKESRAKEGKRILADRGWLVIVEKGTGRGHASTVQAVISEKNRSAHRPSSDQETVRPQAALSEKPVTFGTETGRPTGHQQEEQQIDDDDDALEIDQEAAHVVQAMNFASSNPRHDLADDPEFPALVLLARQALDRGWTKAALAGLVTGKRMSNVVAYLSTVLKAKADEAPATRRTPQRRKAVGIATRPGTAEEHGPTSTKLEQW